MEDLCTICEPLTEAGVTAYPMKVEKKKSREETDLVSVVEWASSKQPDLRYFLLVRRPDEGSGVHYSVVDSPTNDPICQAC